tara:strand:+ start:3875 stop:4897 length:1023 start_codon:yes stop_codon:yes gene_type:complete
VRKKKVLIIGGAGFIGSSISKYLLKNKDYEIHVADNFFRGSSRLSDLSKSIDNLKIFDVDLTLTKSYEILDRNYDYVYVLASIVGVNLVNKSPEEVIYVNSFIILNTLEWLKNTDCKKVLFSSTSETYAGAVEKFSYKIPTDEKVPLTIEDVSEPRFSYAITKILGEAGFINYAKKYSFDAVIVRYHNVYGPDMGFRHVIPHLVERFKKKENPFLIYGYNQTRSFNYIDDAVVGTILAMEKGDNGEIFHIGDEIEISIATLTKYVGSLLKFTGDFENAPTFAGSVARRCPNIEKAKKELGYIPKIDWQSGVKITVDWYLNFLNKNTDHSESFYDQYGINK